MKRNDKERLRRHIPVGLMAITFGVWHIISNNFYSKVAYTIVSSFFLLTLTVNLILIGLGHYFPSKN